METRNLYKITLDGDDELQVFACGQTWREATIKALHQYDHEIDWYKDPRKNLNVIEVKPPYLNLINPSKFIAREVIGDENERGLAEWIELLKQRIQTSPDKTNMRLFPLPKKGKVKPCP